nr:hypothetical protein [Tanacetum cinerariifolium]
MSQQKTHPFGDDNADSIIPGPACILQLAQLRKTSEIKEGGHNGEMSTQEYVRKITEEASEDDHFTLKVFHKDTSVVDSGYGASTSRKSYWAEEI